jgi:putative DNA primase/helicase
LRAQWRDNPLLNAGVALGPVSGLVAADTDGPDGEHSLAKVSGGDLPPTLEFVSGRENGGRRLLYAIPPGVVLRSTHPKGEEIAGGLSLLGCGSQTVMPPSRHRSGRLYQWVPGHGPGEILAAPAPAWLAKLMAADGSHWQQRAGKGERSGEGEPIHETTRNTTLTSLAGTMRRRGMTFEEIRAALLVVNQNRCAPPLQEGEVEGIAASVARYKPADFPRAFIRPARSRHAVRTLDFTVTIRAEEVPDHGF